MAYGDSYSAVQAASLAEKQMSNGIVNTLIGVLQNRKQLQQQQEQFDQNHALALMQHQKLQEENDWRRTIDEKKLQADAADLDFKKSIQAFNEKNLIEGRDIDWAKLGNEEDKNTEIGAANRLREKAFNFDSEQQRTQNDRAAIADYESGMERYKYASAYADAQNEVRRLEQLTKDNAKKHNFWGSNEPGYEKPEDIATALASAKEHLDQLKLTKGVSELAVFSLPQKKYVPVVRPPAEPTALRSSGADTESGNIDSGAGFNPLLRGAAPSASAPVQPQQDPTVIRIQRLISMGVPEAQAYAQAVSESNDSKNPDSFSRF